MDINIGLALKQVIEGKGLNKAELARKLEITPQGLNSMFKRESIETKTLTRIAEMIEVPIKYFFGEKWDDAKISQNADRGSMNNNNVKGRDFTSTFNEDDSPKYGLSKKEADLQLCMERVKQLEARLIEKDERLKDKDQMIELLKKK